MTMLRSIEQKLESLVEGLFGRAFRTHVQPVELARKLQKEMDDHRTVSVSRVYVPNEYTVYLSPSDREQFEGYEGALVEELQTYLTEHARRESYALVTAPRVLIEVDDDLDVGEFGIATRLLQPDRSKAEPGEPASQAAPGQTMVYRPAEPTPPPEPAPTVAVLTWPGGRRALDSRSVLIGRSKECEIRLDDSNVSRRHAEIRQEGTSYWIVDLGSTNGLEVNGRRLKRSKLEHGDRVTLGSTQLVFRREAP
jgi:hypothetical protein